MLTKLSDYPLACLHPIRVRNRYTHDWVVTGCGTCPACLKIKSSKYVGMSSSMAANSACQFFITLTYAPDYMPTASIQYTMTHLNASVYAFEPTRKKLHCRSWDVDEDYIADYDDSDKHFFNLGMPCVNNSSYLGQGIFGVLCKRHLQNFFKRLRKLLSYALPSLSFKYLACGEYGSRSFRPHYHAVIYCSHTVTNAEFACFVSLCWKSGRVDCQPVARNAASYVATYCTASASLPKFLACKAFRPFIVHSAFKDFTFDKSESKARLLEQYASNSPYVVTKDATGISVLPLPSSLRLFYYPKPTGFRELTNSGVRKVLSRFANAVEQQHTTNPKFKVDVRVPVYVDSSYLVQNNGSHNCVVESRYCTLSEIRNLYQKEDSPRKHNQDTLLFPRLYSDLYASYRVWRLACCAGIGVYSVISNILQFYRGSASQPLNWELALLRSQYESFELCDTVSDVKFLYRYFNSPYPDYDVLANGLGKSTDMEFANAVARFKLCVTQKDLMTIKHKDRNSYYQYSKFH